MLWQQEYFCIIQQILNLIGKLPKGSSKINRSSLNRCPPYTEIFSKRRKIYSFCVESLRMPPLPTKKPPGESWTQEGFASAALPRWTNVSCFNENATKIWLLMIKWPFLLRGHVEVYVCDDDQRHLPQLVNKAGESERWPTRKTFSLTRFETFSPTWENVFSAETLNLDDWHKRAGGMARKYVWKTHNLWTNAYFSVKSQARH